MILESAARFTQQKLTATNGCEKESGMQPDGAL
jgi:hypothetical protein